MKIREFVQGDYDVDVYDNILNLVYILNNQLKPLGGT